MSTPITRRTVLAGTGAAALLSATGVSLADEHEDDEDNDLDEDDPAFAAVNTVHASPDAPEVDVYVNGARILESVAFRDISDYLVLLEGEYQMQVVPVEDDEVDNEDDNGVGEDDEDEDDDVGMDEDEDDDVGMNDDDDDDVGMDDDENDIDVDEEAVIDEQIDVAAGVATAAVVGEVDEGTDRELELLVLDVDIDDLDDNESRVRAVHASPDAPEVDIVADDDPLVEGLGFGDFETFDVEEGEYSLEVRAAGEDESVADFDVTLDAGVAYSAFAVGYLEDDDNGLGDDDEEDDNGFGDNNDNGIGNDADTGFDLLLSIDALSPQAEVEEMPEDEEDDDFDDEDDDFDDEDDDFDDEDDNGIGDDDEDDNGIGEDDDDEDDDDEDDNGVGDDDDDEDDDGIFDSI